MTAPNLETLTVESLDQIMTWLKAGVETGGSFVAEQAPLIAQEIILFGRATHTFYMFVSLSALIVSIGLFRLVLKNIHKADDEPDAMVKTVVGGVLGVIFGIGGFIATGEMARDFFLAWFAPRLYIIEYLSNLL